MSRFARRVYLHLAALVAVTLGASAWGLDSRVAWSLGAMFALSAAMTIHAEVGRRCRKVVRVGYESNTLCILPAGHEGDCGDAGGYRHPREVQS